MAGLTEALREFGRVGIDTAVFIHQIEGSSRFATPAGEALDAVARGVCDGVTSSLTVMELGVQPLGLGRPEIADEYEVLLATFPNLVIIDIDRRVARRAAELRAIYRLRTPDALHIAACLSAGASAFLTNDRNLRRVTELSVLLLEDFVVG